MILLLINRTLVIVKNFARMVREEVCEEIVIIIIFCLLMWHVGS